MSNNKKKRIEVGRYLITDPRFCHGKLTFKGTRVPVETVLHYQAKGRTIDLILEGWPELTREGVEEAVELRPPYLPKRQGAGMEGQCGSMMVRALELFQLLRHVIMPLPVITCLESSLHLARTGLERSRGYLFHWIRVRGE